MSLDEFEISRQRVSEPLRNAPRDTRAAPTSTDVIGLEEDADRRAHKAAMACTRAARALRHIGAYPLVRDGRRGDASGSIKEIRESQPLVQVVPDRVVQIPVLNESAADEIDPILVTAHSVSVARV